MVDDNAIAKGFDILFDKLEVTHTRKIKRTLADALKRECLSRHTRRARRHDWLCRLAEQMKQFNMSTTGCSELDKAISKRN